MTNDKIGYDEIVKHLEKSYTLYYVDYRDSFAESLNILQDRIHGDSERFDEMFFNWDVDYGDIKSTLANAIAEEFSIELEEAESIIEENWDEVRYVIDERDDSEVFKDLLKNTSTIPLFYDTCVEIEEYDKYSAKVKQVKKALKIKLSDNSFDDALEEMIQNASYGGRLVIYFTDKLKELCTDTNKVKQIEFCDPIIAIINNGNGSGWHADFKGLKVKFPFNRENVFICKEVHYSYTYEVCGMSSNWCNDTYVELIEKKTKAIAKTSKVNDHIAAEKLKDETYRKGGCTPLDMNINRHRDTYYDNNYPCGTHCPHCGTFWID